MKKNKKKQEEEEEQQGVFCGSFRHVQMNVTWPMARHHGNVRRVCKMFRVAATPFNCVAVSTTTHFNWRRK
jgi:hypothetical protein